ncbi:hypothetical protein HRbin19_00653 [bacterium HR19]|nr:hypothetical protein HRbin19_00653 [bacterium HR19]
MFVILRLLSFSGFFISISFFFQLSLWLYLKEIFLLSAISFFVSVLLLFFFFTPSFVLEKILVRLKVFFSWKEIVNFKIFSGLVLFHVFAIYFIVANFSFKEIKLKRQAYFMPVSGLIYQLSISYPSVFVFSPLENIISEGIYIDGERFYPVSYPPKSVLILCNEDGNWVYHISDSFGFRNEDEVWNKKGQIIFLGGYTVAGFCAVKPFSKLVEELTSLPILNLGHGGEDVLISSLILKELESQVNPQAVFLFISPSEVMNLKRTWENPIVRLYFRKEKFSQGIFSHKVKDIFFEKLKTNLKLENLNLQKSEEKKKTFPDIFYKLFRFFKVEELFAFIQRKRRFSLSGEDAFLLTVALKDIRDFSKRKGAEFFVVYVPDPVEVFYKDFRVRKKVLSVLELLGIRYFDLTDDILNSGTDFEKFFSYEILSGRIFYNSYGHIFIASSLKKHLGDKFQIRSD